MRSTWVDTRSGADVSFSNSSIASRCNDRLCPCYAAQVPQTEPTTAVLSAAAASAAACYCCCFCCPSCCCCCCLLCHGVLAGSCGGPGAPPAYAAAPACSSEGAESGRRAQVKQAEVAPHEWQEVVKASCGASEYTHQSDSSNYCRRPTNTVISCVFPPCPHTAPTPPSAPPSPEQLRRQRRLRAAIHPSLHARHELGDLTPAEPLHRSSRLVQQRLVHARRNRNAVGGGLAPAQQALQARPEPTGLTSTCLALCEQPSKAGAAAAAAAVKNGVM